MNDGHQRANNKRNIESQRNQACRCQVLSTHRQSDSTETDPQIIYFVELAVKVDNLTA